MKYNKQNIKSLMEIIGSHIKKYWIMGLVILGIIILMDIFFLIYWNISDDIVAIELEYAFTIGQIFIMVITVAEALLILLNKFNKLNTQPLVISSHIYIFLLMALGTVDFIFDLSLGDASLLYLLIFSVIAGLFVVEPIFYTSTTGLSLISIIIAIIIKPEAFFGGKYLIENVINLIAFIIVLSLISYRNYRVTIFEFKVNQRLEALSYKDELTGLLNERSYINEIEYIDSKIKNGEEVKFAVVLMDVNNLKATNDAYGHRYGCSLVVRCGKTLPEIFKNSKLFHVGGDEFLAIVYGNDYDNFDELMKEFDEKMIYSIVEYEGQKLIFSVARGFAKYTNEEKFRDVLQIADDAMYINKKAIKEKYNMKSR